MLQTGPVTKLQDLKINQTKNRISASRETPGLYCFNKESEIWIDINKLSIQFCKSTNPKYLHSPPCIDFVAPDWPKTPRPFSHWRLQIQKGGKYDLNQYIASPLLICIQIHSFFMNNICNRKLKYMPSFRQYRIGLEKNAQGVH